MINFEESLIYEELSSRIRHKIMASAICLAVGILLIVIMIINGDFEFIFVLALILTVYSLPAFCYSVYYLIKEEKQPLIKRILSMDNYTKSYLDKFDKEIKDKKHIKKLDMRHYSFTPNYVEHKTFFTYNVFKYTEIYQMYITQTRNSVNFIPTGTDHALTIILNTGEVVKIGVRSKADTDELFTFFAPKAIYAKLGYTKE